MNQDISPPSYQTPTAPVTPTNPEMTPVAPDAPQPAPQVIGQQSGPKRSKGKGILLVVLFLLLLAAAVGGAYYYQQGKLNTLGTAKMSADRQIISLQSQLTAAQSKAAATAKTTTTTTTPAAVNYNIVTGNVATQAAATASISGLYKPGTIDELWLEYGNSPDALKTATVHITQGLTAGDPNTYAQQTIKLTGLTTGQNYFYHVAAKAKGATIYGGTAAFTATK